MDVNANKRKGDEFERRALQLLQDCGIPAHRTFNAGIPADVGDIHAGRITVQCKAVARHALAEWVDEVDEQALRRTDLTHLSPGVVLVKRRGWPDNPFVVMSFDSFIRLRATT